MNSLRDDLQHAPLLARLSPEQLDGVISHAVRLTLSEGEPLFAQGDPADRFFLVLSGQVKLFRLSPDGNEKIIEIITAGQTFAEALMFLEHPRYPVCASALINAELISMDAHSFATMLRESVDTCFLLLGDLSQRLRGLIKEVDDLSLQSGTCRVAAYLLKMTPRESEAFELDIPKGVMASRLSVKPETFSRIIRSLQEQGILTVNRNLVTIHDLSALEATAEVCESGLDNRFPANDYPFIPGKP